MFQRLLIRAEIKMIKSAITRLSNDVGILND